MTSKNRRDVFAFIAFLVACGTTLGAVLLVEAVDSADRWAAIAAVAGAVQASAVVVALLYASKQINSNQNLATRARRQQYVDRLEPIVRGPLFEGSGVIWNFVTTARDSVEDVQQWSEKVQALGNSVNSLVRAGFDAAALLDLLAVDSSAAKDLHRTASQSFIFAVMPLYALDTSSIDLHEIFKNLLDLATSVNQLRVEAQKVIAEFAH